MYNELKKEDVQLLQKEFQFDSENKKIATIRFSITGTDGDYGTKLLEFFAQCSHAAYMELAQKLNSTL